MGEIIVIASGKGGVGKTTTTANIGVGLAKKNKRVLLVDADIGLRDLDLLLGMENYVIYNLVDYVEGKCDLDQAVLKHKEYENLFFLPTAQSKDKLAVTPDQMRALMEKIRDQYDYILVDCPAGIERGFENAVAGVNRGIVVTNPDNPAIRDADRIISMLQEKGIRDIEVIVNRVRISMVDSGNMISPDEIYYRLGLPILGILPDDEAVIISSNEGKPVIESDSKVAKAYNNICERLLGNQVEMLDLHEYKVRKSFWDRFKRKKQG